MIATRPIDVLRFLRDCLQGGDGAVLVTLAGIEGSSPRGLGTQMAVGADGRAAGSLSGGCLDAAIIAEALSVLDEGRSRIVRFGMNSTYIDIRLPCGGGVDLLFTPMADRRAVERIIARLDARLPVNMEIDAQNGDVKAAPAMATGWAGDGFTVGYQPLPAVKVFGQGEEVVSFAGLAVTFGLDVEVLTPDRTTLDALRRHGVAARHLVTMICPQDLRTDDWTAILLLMHDREWEDMLLPGLLALPAFYIGAIGSRRTQRARVERLGRAGVPHAHLERLEDAVGLIPGTRDPATLSLSVLAQIVERFSESPLPPVDLARAQPVSA